MICEEEFIRRINIDIKLLSRLFLASRNSPACGSAKPNGPASPASFAEIRSRAARPGDVYSPEVLRSMIRTLAYKGLPHHRAAHRVAARPWETSARSRNDEYFNQFMSELTKHYMQERSVGFYAGQSCT